MQKAILYVSKLIAARGVLELTDRRLCFQVSSFDASFGMKSVSIDLCSISKVAMECGDLHPRVVVSCGERSYEFVLSKGQELYDRVRDLMRDPLRSALEHECASEAAESSCAACGKRASDLYRYCPWCGAKLESR